MMYLKALNRQKKIVLFGIYESKNELKSKVQKDCKIEQITEKEFEQLKQELMRNSFIK